MKGITVATSYGEWYDSWMEVVDEVRAHCRTTNAMLFISFTFDQDNRKQSRMEQNKTNGKEDQADWTCLEHRVATTQRKSKLFSIAYTHEKE